MSSALFSPRFCSAGLLSLAALLVTLTSCDAGVDPGTDTGPRADVRADGGTGSDAPAVGTDAPRADAPSMPMGSAGCGMASPATGDLTLMLAGDTLEYFVSIPAGYDPARPYPLGFGLHGAGRTHTNCHDGDCAGFQSEMEDVAILVYPRSQSRGWQDDAGIRARNMALFTALLDRMLAGYCVETDRIFVAGTSSGATFANDIGCQLGDRVRAVIPVAGGVPRGTCVGTPAALVIHGVDDPHVLFSYGEEARDAYSMANGCMPETDPAIADLHARVVMNRESHECADYRGCDSRSPVRWCEHSEGGYDGSTHGWPLFGGEAIWDFVSALP